MYNYKKRIGEKTRGASLLCRLKSACLKSIGNCGRLIYQCNESFVSEFYIPKTAKCRLLQQTQAVRVYRSVRQ